MLCVCVTSMFGCYFESRTWLLEMDMKGEGLEEVPNLYCRLILLFPPKQYFFATFLKPLDITISIHEGGMIASSSIPG